VLTFYPTGCSLKGVVGPEDLPLAISRRAQILFDCRVAQARLTGFISISKDGPGDRSNTLTNFTRSAVLLKKGICQDTSSKRLLKLLYPNIKEHGYRQSLSAVH
jgi:hypothetical protein